MSVKDFKEIPITWYEFGFWGHGYIVKFTKTTFHHKDIDNEKISISGKSQITNFFHGHINYQEIENGNPTQVSFPKN